MISFVLELPNMLFSQWIITYKLLKSLFYARHAIIVTTTRKKHTKELFLINFLHYLVNFDSKRTRDGAQAALLKMYSIVEAYLLILEKRWNG